MLPRAIRALRGGSVALRLDNENLIIALLAVELVLPDKESPRLIATVLVGTRKVPAWFAANGQTT